MIKFKRIPENIYQKMGLLDEFLLSDSNVIFAYLCGGMVRAKPSPLSDVDIAVYVKDIKKLDYLEMFGKIANILGTDEIDLVILNRAPLSLAGRLLQGRKVMVDKKPFVRHLFESRILRESFDFAIKERDILKRRYGIGR